MPGYKQTELGAIPTEWDVHYLSKITDPKRPIGYGIVQTGRRVANGVKCVRVVDIENGRVNGDDLITTSKEISAAYKRTLLVEGDLVIALRGKIGALAIIEKNLTGANLTRGVALLAPLAGYDSKYLCHYLSSPGAKQVFEKNLNGSALQEIPIATLRKIPAIVPPLPEQCTIASALSDVDALLGAQDKLIAKKRDLKQAAMQQLLTRGKRLPGFLGEWEVARIGEIADVKTGPFGSSLHESDYVQDGTPIITVEHLGEFGVTHSNLPLVSGSDLQRLRPYSLEFGDIVFSRVGSVDRNALIRAAEVGWLFSGRLLRVRPDKRKAFAPFLSYQFHSETFKSKVRNVTVGQTMASLNTHILKDVTIVLPSIAEQTAIAGVLTDMDAELAALEQRRTKTRGLKQGMMQELLTGRTRLV